MNTRKLIQRIIYCVMLAVVLSGCETQTTTPDQLPPPAHLPTASSPPDPTQAQLPLVAPEDEVKAILGSCMNDWEYGGEPQRMGVLKSVDHGNSWSYLGHVCFPGIDPHAGLALADPSPIIINNEIVLFFFELNTHDEATRIMGRATPPLNDGLVFSIPTVAFSHPDLVFGPYVLRFHDNTYRMYMGTMPGTLYDYEGIISASSSDGSTFILDQDVLTIGGLPGALLVPPGLDNVRLYVSTGNIESFVSQNGLTNFTADKPTPLRVRNAGGAHPIKLQHGNLPYQYFLAFATAAYAARESFTQPAELSIILTATSDDTVDWNVIPMPAILGSVPGVVELLEENGTLLLYFIDFWWNKLQQPCQRLR